uniref:Kynurenine 3-monooxygenase n=1 Tax=Limnogonus franciscanus TaxID=913166 RepID=A0A5C1YTX1_9HEMI|nr:cinnabar [Limnogonus franciscanus]
MENTENGKKLRVAIIGGGLVGSLSACYFGKRGHEVHLYEYRKDIRKDELARGRSINLALSTRGRRALAGVGLEDKLVSHHGLPMYARMLHMTDGSTRAVPYDPVNNQCIYSVGRRHLNQSLLDEAEDSYNVQTYFEHKLINIDFEDGKLYFRRPACIRNCYPSGPDYWALSTSYPGPEQTYWPDKAELIEAQADLIVGADGAFSTVRRLMSRRPLFNYSQQYIEHGYLELSIPPTEDNQFAMESEYLHIWPRGSFMLIALPNQDKSWTVTLFMSHQQFKSITKSDQLLEFFKTNFPDALKLIGEDRLVKDFFQYDSSSLLSVKCSPYNVGSRAVIIGDAAHAMVPFYGQGMNAGFEDCYLLDDLLHNHGLSLEDALEAFSKTRPINAHAICDLAMYNYVEMRDLVARSTFLWRKKLDTLLYTLAPSKWIPLYNSVTFSHMDYSKCISNRAMQDKALKRMLLAAAVGGLGIVIAVWQKTIRTYLGRKL